MERSPCKDRRKICAAFARTRKDSAAGPDEIQIKTTIGVRVGFELSAGHQAVGVLKAIILGGRLISPPTGEVPLTVRCEAAIYQGGRRNNLLSGCSGHHRIPGSSQHLVELRSKPQGGPCFGRIQRHQQGAPDGCCTVAGGLA